MSQQTSYDCKPTTNKVILYRQRLIYSEVGEDMPGSQFDYACSHESDCDKRYTAACKVFELYKKS